MSQGWMRVRDAAHLMGVSQTTVRRRVDGGELRGKVGKSGRQEVFLPAKMRRELELRRSAAPPPGHLDRGMSAEEADAAALEIKQQSRADAVPAADPCEDATVEVDPPAEMIKRFERLAGGSLILAQQRSDELHKHTESAYEQLAHARSQVRQLRKVALVGWAGCAATLIFGVMLSVTFGLGMARAEAAAEASDSHARQADRRADRMSRDLADAALGPAKDGELEPVAPLPLERGGERAAPTAVFTTPMSSPDTAHSTPMRQGRTGPGRSVFVPTE